MVNSSFNPHFSTGIQAGDSKLTPAELPAAKFCSLWHCWDFIQADIPASGQKPNWERITNYPLDPCPLFRRWSSPSHLIGVSFGDTTGYCLLDIDAGSQYHPQRSLEALKLVLSALEDIGLVRPLIVQSSASGGLHVYFPLHSPVKTFHLAHLLRQTLENTGLEIKAGQLELFPNTKTWKPQGEGFSLYNAHRLPLQQDSYLLDPDLNPQSNDLEQFLAQWDQAAAHQDQQTLEQAIATTQIRSKVTPITQARSRRAEDWYQDERARIAQGWTGPGQSNDLLLAIGRFGRVFERLAGPALLDYMVTTAKACPGYRSYCAHQHEIEKRCRHWSLQIEEWYSPYRSRPARVRQGQTNEERSQAAQARIKAAVTELEANGTLPSGVKARMQAIAAYGIAPKTLYKHKPLWYPGIYPQPCETPDPEQITATYDSTPQTAEAAQTEEFHTPPLRSLAQPDEASSDPEIYLSSYQPPRRDPSTEIAVQTGNSTPSTEAQTSPFALKHETVLDLLVPTCLPKVQPSPDEQAEFAEWFSLAQQFGVVIDSEIEGGEIWVLTTTGDWEPWTEVSAMFTPPRLRRMLELKPE